ncbi:LIM domain-binding protein 3-like isoform X3 [Patiria miniata]|uniref:PDZ and LIM domain protein Zasp n=1 Tax=Patiria miniata TaxID=46514 RepID=A0A914A9I9_PATMI|nr:LIM domain-binding protein 3-like isoform X3 [Patiria miniata]
MPGGKMLNITIQGPGPWGFRLAGGKDFNTPLYISKVTTGGKASNSNVLMNDCVTAINGMDTESMTHLEAQGAIKNAVGNLSLKIMRGEATLWKPKIGRDETDAVTNVSLQADKQKFTHAGARHNQTAKPFGSPGAGGGLGTATVVHKQFNSPAGIYSAENIADSFKGQTEGMIAGHVGAEITPASQGYSQPAKAYTPTYQEPPTYNPGQASARYIDKPDDEEMKYSGFINPGSQSRSFKMLQTMTADEEANMPAPPSGVRSVKAPVAVSGGSKPAPTLPMCVRCNLGIVGPVLKAKDKTLHPECFTCYTCSNSLKNKGFFTVQGKEYCGNCERQARIDASPGPQGSYTNGSSTAAHHPAAHQHSGPPPPPPLAHQRSGPPPPAVHQYSAPPPPVVDNKQAPSQIASQARSNPVARPMSSQVPRAPGPPPAPAYAKSSPRPAPMSKPAYQQHPPAPAASAGGAGAAGRTPMCDGCDSMIRGPFVSAVGRNWHPEHFVCAHCHQNLSTQGFVEQNGKVYCERDFNSLYAPNCAICNRPISQGGCVQAMGSQYHSDCFVCHHCKDPITGTSFHISEGKPYCKRDYQKLFSVRCAACNYPVEPGDAWVEALNKQWHSNCFTCSNPSCGVPLEGQAFYADRGQPYCKMHAP